MSREGVADKQKRSHAKTKIQTSLAPDFYEHVNLMTYIFSKSRQDVGATIARAGFRSEVYECIKPLFRRPFEPREGQIIFGDINRSGYVRPTDIGRSPRVQMKFFKKEYDLFSELQYALDAQYLSETVELTMVFSFLAESSLVDIISKLMLPEEKKYRGRVYTVEVEFNNSRMTELIQVLRYAQKHSSQMINSVDPCRLLKSVERQLSQDGRTRELNEIRKLTQFMIMKGYISGVS